MAEIRDLVNVKICLGCGQLKKFSEYHAISTNKRSAYTPEDPHYYRSQCKSCAGKAAQDYRARSKVSKVEVIQADTPPVSEEETVPVFDDMTMCPKCLVANLLNIQGLLYTGKLGADLKPHVCLPWIDIKEMHKYRGVYSGTMYENVYTYPHPSMAAMLKCIQEETNYPKERLLHVEFATWVKMDEDKVAEAVAMYGPGKRVTKSRK